MADVEIHGGCMCGEVRYVLTGEPLSTTMCHCSDCRLSAGAQSVAWVTVKDRHFSITKGEPRRYLSSPHVERMFCPKCGTSLSYRSEKRNREIDITTGSLDHPEEFAPTQDYYCRDRLPWVQPSTENQKE